MGHREDLLAAARRCLAERGYARTTARDLVAASGTNLASIGYHFGSKEALLNAALTETFTEWAEHVRALALAATPVAADHARDEGQHDAEPGRAQRENVEYPAVETTAVETTAVETTAVETTGVETTGVETTGVERADGKAGRPAVDTSALLAASLGGMLASFAEYRGLGLAFLEALAQAGHQAELRATLAAAYRRSRDQVAAMVGELIAQVNPEQSRSIAAFEIAMCDGLLIQWLLDPTDVPSGAQLTEALTAALGHPPPGGGTPDRRVPASPSSP